jgi:hypothetical protein
MALTREGLVAGGGEHIGFERGRRDAEARQQVGAGKMRELAACIAHAEVERGLAVVDGLELRVAVGHMQERQLSLRREPKQVVLADRALRRRAPEPRPEAGDGRRRRGLLQELAAGDHRPVTCSPGCRAT